jgi:hypothetical protein
LAQAQFEEFTTFLFASERFAANYQLQAPVADLGPLTEAELLATIQLAAARQAARMEMDDPEDPPDPPSQGQGEGATNGVFGWTTNSLRFIPPVLVTTNGQTTNVVLLIAGGVENGIYDLYFATNLNPVVFYGFTNLATAWDYLYRCAPGQTNLTHTNAPMPWGFYILGITNDTDGDSLPDAFEGLVSHTSASTNDTEGDGLNDYLELLIGANPRLGHVPDTNGLLRLCVHTPLK